MRREIEQREAVLLEEILHVVFRRKLLIIALLLLAGGIFAYGVLTEVDVYKGEAIVMIRRLAPGYQMPAESRAVLLRGEVVNSELAIITSPAVAEGVVDRLGLDVGKNRARVIHNVNRQIRGEAEPESNIIKISYSSPDAVKAAEVTNAALDAYLSVRARVSLDYDAVGYLDTQARRVKAEIDSIGAEITRYGAEDGQLSRGVKGEQHMGLINRFKSELSGLDSSIYSKQEKITATEEWLASGADIAHAPNSEIYEMETVRQAKTMLLDLKLDLAEARARYAPSTPRSEGSSARWNRRSRSFGPRWNRPCSVRRCALTSGRPSVGRPPGYCRSWSRRTRSCRTTTCRSACWSTSCRSGPICMRS